MKVRLIHLWPGSRTVQRWLLHAIVFTFVCYLVSFIPKPLWMCSNHDHKAKAVNSDSSGSSADVVQERKSHLNVKDPHDTKIFHMFPIYSKENGQADHVNNNRETSRSEKPAVKIFHLQNFNFSNFGRTWLNKMSENELQPQHSVKHLRESNKKQLQPQLVWEKLQKNEKLPDCVKLKVPFDAMPTKICVHYEHDDNFISNALRDTAIWELELVFQMDEFFRRNPQSQLIDLGCNVGVFTLFAASLGKPALAVDILPSNLALIQLSIAVNDRDLEQRSAADDVKDILHSIGYEQKIRPKYSDIITTVHNAIYSKRARMYVYLKEDPNLGGTEVKELNIPQDSILNNHTKDSLQADVHATDFFNEKATSIPNDTRIHVDAICLDDLIPYVQANLSVFLKMDIEGSEPDVFLCANNFFMHVNVRVILMEILFHRYSELGKKMANFLLLHNMVPSEDVAGRKLLDADPNRMYTWPENMFWINIR